MNSRTELLTKNFTPIMMLSVYRSKSEVTGHGEYYLESHDVNAEGQVLEGKPLLQETIQGIIDVFFDERKNMAQISGMLPENLLNFTFLPGGNYQMIWFRPAEQRVIHFAPQLKIPTDKAWVPAMVYRTDGKQLSVYSIKSNNRPKEDTRLCYAPFFNVSDYGNVCLGSAHVKRPKQKTYTNLMQYWEDLFWLSEFTHVNGNDMKTATKLQPLWKKIIGTKGKQKWSDLNELKFWENKTLKSLLK